jgi:hypothetical protein
MLYLYLFTWLLEPFQTRRFPQCVFCFKHLVQLALPLETEGLVDPEFPEDGEEGKADGNAASVSVHLRGV